MISLLKKQLIAILLLPGSIYCSNVHGQTADLTGTDCSGNTHSQQIQVKNDCPKFYQALKKNGLVTSLEAPLPKQLSLTQLQMLQKAIIQTNKFEPLDESGLNALLAKIYIEKSDDQTIDWWKQFLSWLNGFKPEKFETEYNWLVKFLEAIIPSEQTARFIMYATFGLIILLAIGLVLWELYLSGIFYRKKHHHKKNIETAFKPVNPKKKHLSFAEIKQLAPSLQSVALLKSVISQLMDTEFLPKNSALTNLELKQFLQTTRSSNSQPFSQLLNLVEPVIYGNEKPSEQAIKQCWLHAEKIIEP